MALRVLTGAAVLCGVLGGAVSPAGARPGGALDLRGRRIDRIDVQAAPGVERQRAIDLSGLEVGKPLSIAAVRRAVEKLFATAMFSDVIVRARDVDGKLVVTIELAPRVRLREIRFAGNAAIRGDDLRKDFEFAPDQEFTPDTVEELRRSLERSYRRRGFYRARFEIAVRTLPGGERVLLDVEVQEGEPTRVEQIRFRGKFVFSPRELRKRLKLATGDRLDRQRLRNSVDNLREFYQKRGYYEVRLEEPEVTLPVGMGDAVLTFQIDAGLRTEVRFIGARGFSRKELLTWLKIEDERHIDEGTVSVLRERLRRAIQERGFYRATVTGKLETLRGARPRKRLTFWIWPGARVRVVELRFPGARAVPVEQLRELVFSLVEERLARVGLFTDVYPEDLSQEFGVGAPHGGTTAENRSARPLSPREVYLESAYLTATEEVAELYKGLGFSRAQVDKPRVVAIPRSPNVIVEIPIREGVRTTVRSVRFAGHKSVTLEDLRKDLQIEIGRPYNPNQVEETRLRIQKRYERLGYIFARVEDEAIFTTPVPDGVTITFQISEGPPVRVGRIFIEGNVATKTGVIEDVLAVQPGDVFDPEKVNLSQRALFDLGLFSSVRLDPEQRDVPEKFKNLRVQVRERKPGTMETGLGFSTGDGPRGFFNLSYNNLFGYNLRALLTLKLNYQLFLFADDASRRRRLEELRLVELLERQATFSLHYPKILGVPFPLGARLDLVNQRRSQLAFGLDRNSVLVGLEVKLTSGIAFQLQYELENSTLQAPRAQSVFEKEVDLSPLSFRDKELLKRTTRGTVNLGSIRPIISLDLRDNPFNPRSGMFAAVTLEYSTTVTQSSIFVNYMKLFGTLTGYVPITRNTLIALQVAGGRILHLSERSQTPAHKAFYLGGRGSVRGYPEESIIPEGRPITPSEANNLFQFQLPPTSTGGDIYALAKAELRFPIAGKLAGALFFDAGNLWLNVESFDFFVPPRLAVGFGIRYPTPVGPLSLDYGVNLTRRFVFAENPETRQVERAFYEGFGAFHFSIGVF